VEKRFRNCKMMSAGRLVDPVGEHTRVEKCHTHFIQCLFRRIPVPALARPGAPAAFTSGQGALARGGGRLRAGREQTTGPGRG